MPLLGLPLLLVGFALAALPPLLEDGALLLGLSLPLAGPDPAGGEDEPDPDEEEDVDEGEEDKG